MTPAAEGEAGAETLEVPPGESPSGQGERLEAVLIAHAVDSFAERHFAPAFVERELKGVVGEVAQAHAYETHPARADVELVDSATAVS